MWRKQTICVILEPCRKITEHCCVCWCWQSSHPALEPEILQLEVCEIRGPSWGASRLQPSLLLSDIAPQKQQVGTWAFWFCFPLIFLPLCGAVVIFLARSTFIRFFLLTLGKGVLDIPGISFNLTDWQLLQLLIRASLAGQKEPAHTEILLQGCKRERREGRKGQERAEGERKHSL